MPKLTKEDAEFIKDHLEVVVVGDKPKLPVKPPAPDIRCENHGSIFLLRGLTDAGRAWLDSNLEAGPMLGDAHAVEPRYVENIVDGICEAGLCVEHR